MIYLKRSADMVVISIIGRLITRISNLMNSKKENNQSNLGVKIGGKLPTKRSGLTITQDPSWEKDGSTTTIRL